ncbi:MAG: TetR/AcrR family transcriptional regulator [Desulfatibacillaceae bacterium]
MPKPQRSRSEIAAVRDNILETACDILFRDGFERLSMRRLARELGMTAANIYNYFRNKDELYLAIQKHGFEMLEARLSLAAEGERTPETRLRSVAREYLAFGMDQAHYYEIMLNRHGPKYADYAPTDMEPVARAEKDAAMEALGVVLAVAVDAADTAGLSADRAKRLLYHLWFTLHGFITLYNTRTIQEVEDDPGALAHAVIEDFLQRVEAELFAN